MKFVKQAFELIIIDQLIYFLLHRLKGINFWCTYMLSLAMQLIQQGFELIIRNVTGICGHRCCSRFGWCSANTMQLIQ